MTNKKTRSKYTICLPKAEEEIRNRCFAAAREKYGVQIPEPIKERLDIELQAICKNGYASKYLIGSMMAKYVKDRGYPTCTRGTIASSFVAHLCGITEVNPLPPHRYCPKCHHLELAVEKRKKALMGYDLDEKECPSCGTEMTSSGCDIEPEVLMGADFSREPFIVLNVPKTVRSELIAHLKDTFGEDCLVRAGVRRIGKDGKVKIGKHPGAFYILPKGVNIEDITALRDCESDDEFQLKITERDYNDLYNDLEKYDVLTLSELDMLYTLEQITGHSCSSIMTNDDSVLDVFRTEGFSFLPRSLNRNGIDLGRMMVSETRPNNFSDLVCISALLHSSGGWVNNGWHLIRDGASLKELFTSRDDVMQHLMWVGVERRTAIRIMDRILMAKGITEEMKEDMRAAGVPEVYIESLDKTQYLFPKSHAMEYMLVYWKLAWYKSHFPEDYTKVMKDAVADLS